MGMWMSGGASAVASGWQRCCLTSADWALASYRQRGMSCSSVPYRLCSRSG